MYDYITFILNFPQNYKALQPLSPIFLIIPTISQSAVSALSNRSVFYTDYFALCRVLSCVPTGTSRTFWSVSMIISPASLYSLRMPSNSPSSPSFSVFAWVAKNAVTSPPCSGHLFFRKFYNIDTWPGAIWSQEITLFLNHQLFCLISCANRYIIQRSFLSFYNITCGNTGDWGGGISAKALEGALRPEAESTAYKKLRHSTFVS